MLSVYALLLMIAMSITLGHDWCFAELKVTLLRGVCNRRFSENFFVVSENFRLVFYVMAPLISSNGHRIGTL
jgi:hypothetical protein